MHARDISTPFGRPGFLVLAGSRLFGIDTAESDYDYAGALVEPEAYRIGLKNYSQGKNHQHGFEQHEFNGDNYEGTVYGLWKLASMFAEGNPTILTLLFADPIRDDYGICTPEFRKIVVSARSGHRFMKYMEAQRKSMIGERAQHVKRLELIDAYGYDTKFAGHLIRLGYQGIEFLYQGTITLPMPEYQRGNVLAIRAGKWTMDEVVQASLDLQAEMEAAMVVTDLQPEADWEALNDWVVGKYNTFWVREKQKVLDFRAG